MTSPDILMLDRIGGAYSQSSLLSGGLGGSEIEVLQVAHGLTARGHRVVIANGLTQERTEDGVLYVPHTRAWQHLPTKALYLQRWSTPETRLEVPSDVRVVVRANDVYWPGYNVHRDILSRGRAALVTNTQWQANQFNFAKETLVLPPMLEEMPHAEKQPGLFVFASGASKGFEATVALWCQLKQRHPCLRTAQLAIVSPGWGTPRPLTADEVANDICFIGNVQPVEYRYWIARAEGLFMVSTMTETFCCAAALAERANTRTHILCRAGLGGLLESVCDHQYVTEDAVAFETAFIGALGRASTTQTLPDLSPATLLDRWADILFTPVSDALPVVTSPTRLPARSDGRPTVGLCLIAKGEEAATVATRAIVSAKRLGVDCVTVVCDANEAIADIARALDIDVFVRPSPAIDWERGIGVIAGARNDALALAEQRTDYVLVLDADDWLEGTLPSQFDHDAYEVTIYDGGMQYSRIQLFRSSLGWRYTGIIHETLTTTGAGPIGRSADIRYMRGRSSYAFQDQDPPSVKYAKHAQLMTKWLIDHPDDTRGQFYLARSYHDAGRYAEAITAYEKRITMLGGWEEERSYSAYQIGKILIEQGGDPTVTLIRAHELGVPKAEPLVALARWYRHDTRRQFSTAYAFARRAADIPKPVGGLFIEASIYQFEAAAEVAICAYWLGHIQEALERFEQLLPAVPAERRKWAEEQIAICIQTSHQ